MKPTFITIKGARVHNLKNISLEIPRNKLVVVTGVSGSGKSSLVFDTLYAEGHRRYVESLSAYARQFFGKMAKPDVDLITGISPAVAIEQKVSTSNPRSTVATSIEIYDYLKILFARIGKTISPVSGKEVKRNSVSDVTEYILKEPAGTRVHIFCPIIIKEKKRIKETLQALKQKGFSRLRYMGENREINDLLSNDFNLHGKPDKNLTGFSRRDGYPQNLIGFNPKNSELPLLLIDRVVVSHTDEELRTRISDSVETAYLEGGGDCFVESGNHSKNGIYLEKYSNTFELDGIAFEEPSPQLFSFNSPYGACKRCEGFGSAIGIDEDLVIPDKNLSVYEGAVACWKGEKMSEWKDGLLQLIHKYNFPVHRAYYQLTPGQKKLLWEGNKEIAGINKFFEYVESQMYKIQYRVLLSRYRGKTVCPGCLGGRLRKEAFYVKVGEKNICEIVKMPVSQAHAFFKTTCFSDYEKSIAGRLIYEIISRLHVLEEIGLGYLTLDRPSNTLSGGESQRVNLARAIGSPLVGSLYILDEPSIGLHPRDTQRLTGVLKNLRDNSNTVIVVEHDEEIMRNADYIIDMGPGAGIHGGDVVFSGTNEEILKETKGITSKYLNGELGISIPLKRRKWRDHIEIIKATQHNLKGITIKIPLGAMSVVTGVSGSGKSTLVRDILYPSLRKQFGLYGEKEGLFGGLSGDLNKIDHVEFVDQNPIGRSSRSNPVTYIKAYDEIRALFASLPASKIRGYSPSHFSFNVDGGRCEKCQGEGEVTIEMQFLADVHLICEDCSGKRFKEDVLEIRTKGKNISDVLGLSVDGAIEFFKDDSANIAKKLKPLQEVGLGYVKLGQSSGTLSGGEAQRVKLASFIAQGTTQNRTIFLFDEPTTGLHFHDIGKLLIAFNKLLENGHTVVIIEHNPEIIKCADWIIDLGPEGGEAGGYLVFEGTPDEIVNCKNSYTGRFLKKMSVVEGGK